MLASLFPVVLFIGLGFLAKKLKVFKEDDTRVLIDFVIYFSFPAIVFNNIYHLKINDSLFDMIGAGWAVLFLALFLSFVWSKVAGYDKNTTIVVMMMSVFGNTAFVGIPFIDSFYGEEGIRYAIAYDQFVSFILVSILAPLMISLVGEEFSIQSVARRIFLFPPFIALIVALLLKPVVLPAFLFKSFEMLGSAVVPLALFVAGFGLDFNELKNSIGKVIPVLSIKIIIVPLLFMAVLFSMGKLEALEWKVAVMQSAMPSMVYAAVLAIRGGLDKSIAISSVGLGVVIALLVLPVFYSIM